MLFSLKQVPVVVSSNIFTRRLLLYCVVPWKYPLSSFSSGQSTFWISTRHVCTCTFSLRLYYLREPSSAWNFQWLSMDGVGRDIFLKPCTFIKSTCTSRRIRPKTMHCTIIYLKHFYLLLVMYVLRITYPNIRKATFYSKQVQLTIFHNIHPFNRLPTTNVRSLTSIRCPVLK